MKPIGSLGIGVSGLFVLCSALRLARFNVQTATADKSRFVGLPVPGAAAMMAGLVLAYSYFEFDSPRTLCTSDGADHARARRPDDLASALPQLQNDQARKARAGRVGDHDDGGWLRCCSRCRSSPPSCSRLRTCCRVHALMIRGERLSAKVSVLRPVAREIPRR